MALVTGGIHSISSSPSSQIKHMFDGSGGSLRLISANYKLTAGAEDVTDTNSAGVSRYISKLKTGEISFVARWPKSAPKLGNSAQLTLGGATTTLCTQWRINLALNSPPLAVNAGTGTATVYESFALPVGYTWSGTATCKWLSSNTFSVPPAANSGGSASTFKLFEDGTDPAMTGSVFVENGPDFNIDKSTTVDLRYDFRGDGPLTFVAGSTLPAILPAGALAGFDWDLDGDGLPDITTVCTLYTGKTLTAPMALTALSIGFDGGNAPIDVTGTLKIMGEATLA